MRRVKRLEVMAGQRVEVELLAQDLRKLSGDRRDDMAPAICSKGICA